MHDCTNVAVPWMALSDHREKIFTLAGFFKTGINRKFSDQHLENIAEKKKKFPADKGT